ncbi:efflux RND transporter periplasmic adaptor subunit [Dyella sp. A6]|uniref:efflux RND transporter periplasmic adaptor subunit n=1 Tax=Dyella aluminiiresistens TaxID=3069105 RepID=UPI002E77920A|nr:HlyD family efflux transporter periplasmic adaptor subunit [Dyella sp. A6]
MTSTTELMQTHSRFRTVLRLAAVAAGIAMASACSRHADTPDKAPATVASRYAAMAQGRIDIEGGLLHLSIPGSGMLARVPVRDGETVTRGQLLAQLNEEPAQLAIKAAQAQLENAQAQLKLTQVEQAAAKVRAKRLAAAAASGADAGQNADNARTASEQLAAQVSAAQAGVDLARQKLAEAHYRLQQDSLHAPVDGELVHVAVQAGEAISAGSTAFVLLPDKPRIVRAELNESFVGAVHPGMRAEVLIDGGPDAATWPAHVVRIGQVYGPDTLDNDPQIRANSRAVSCILAFDTPQRLRIGQRVLVRFLPATAAKD